MKMALVFFFFCSVALARPEIVSAPLEHLYVPHGFDSNDSVEVIVTGNFPSTCYSRNNVEVKVIDSLIDIKITAILSDHALSGMGMLCPQMVIPFTETINVGNLQGGEYLINVNSDSHSSLSGSLLVDEAPSNSLNEHIYAAVEWIEKKSKDTIVLHGWRYSFCLEFDRVEIVSNGKDTLSVMPIMKQVNPHCPMKMTPTAYEVKLDYLNLKMKRPLIHVRTMDGKSVNSIINL